MSDPDGSSIALSVNGEVVTLAVGTTVADLLAARGISGPVAVEVNEAVVRRALHATHALQPGDRVEIVHFVGGGR